MPTPAQHSRQTLLGGSEVELLGVSDQPGSDVTWWKPDGSPLAIHPLTFVGATGFKPQQNEKIAIFVFRTHGIPNDAACWTFSSSQGSVWWSMDAGWSPEKHASDLVGFLTVLPSSVETSKVSIGVAAGPWTTVHGDQWHWRAAPSAKARTGFCFSPASEIAGAVTITAAHNLRDLDNRIIAVDMNGREYLATQNSVSANEINMVTCTFPGLAKSRVKTFQLQTRPYAWVKFSNVAASPGQMTHVDVSISNSAYGTSVNPDDTEHSSPPAATQPEAQNSNADIVKEAERRTGQDIEST